MDLKQLVILALQASILGTVFGFGLGSTADDVLYLVRRPGLLARSVLAMFVIVPAIVIVLDLIFDFRPEVKIVLTALAISPVPPLLPGKQHSAGGLASYGIGLMATLGLLSVITVPLSVEILERVLGRSLSIAPGAVAMLVLKTILAPLAAGLIMRAAMPGVADRIEKPVSVISKLLLLLGLIAVLAGALPAVWALIGDGTVVAIAMFVLAGLAVGHLLGGPEREQASVLALSSACRHPMMALTIASASFPDQRFGATVLLYLLVNTVVCLPYVKWQASALPKTQS